MKTFEMSNNEGVQKVMNKVVLFIVEGALDREFFGYYFSELIENKNLEIYVTNGDILTKFTRNPERLIEKHFNSALKKSKFLKGDIERIVHICDIDGSYFDEHQIKISPERDYSLKTYEYNPFLKCINFSSEFDKEQIMKSWNNKRNNQEKLCHTKMIEGIRYDLYYVSLYLEHLLLGQCDHKTSSQKKDIIYDKLDKEINFFIDLFELKKDSDDFDESWDKIRESSISFIPSSNLNILINEYIKNK